MGEGADVLFHIGLVFQLRAHIGDGLGQVIQFFGEPKARLLTGRRQCQGKAAHLVDVVTEPPRHQATGYPADEQIPHRKIPHLFFGIVDERLYARAGLAQTHHAD